MPFKICLECGREISVADTVCPRCGRSVETYPLDGLWAYVGENWHSHYHRQFQRLLGVERTGVDPGWMWNWSAALTPFWFLYRRLYGAFFFYLTLHLVFGAFGLTLVIAIVQGCQGDKLLYRKAYSVVRRAGEGVDPAWLARRGKPQAWVAWSPVVGVVLIGILSAVVVPKFAKGGSSQLAAEQQNATGPLIAQRPKVVLSRDGATQLTVPASWSTQHASNESLQIHVGMPAMGHLVSTWTDSKADIAIGMDLNGYGRLVRDDLRKRLPGSVVSDPLLLTIHGSSAIQYEITDMSDSLPFAVWLTVLETPRNYHRVVAMTDLHRAAESRKLFEEIIQTFKESSGQSPTGAPE